MILGRIFNGKDPGQQGNSFWMEAIAEFVLVVVGILLALQIENWNQDRKDRKLERTLLEEMHSNLQSDLNDVQYNLKTEQNNLESTRIIMNYLNSDIPYHDSLSGHFARMTEGTIFIANTSAFQSLESIGIDLVRNDSLRQQITFLYSATYSYLRKLEDVYNQSTLMDLEHQLAKLVRPVSRQRSVPLDPNEIKMSNEFYSALFENARILGYQVNGYGSTRDRILELMHTIEKELK
ncbi:MAG: DUF6090 family protein [Bacteroidales bacterium]